MNPYKILGLKKKASDNEINDAYRALAKKWHPDLPKGDAEKFRKIKEARDFLLDPRKRQFFDQFGESSDSPAGRAKVMALDYFQQMISGMLSKVPVDQLPKIDIIAKMKEYLNERAAQIENELFKLDQQDANLNKAKAVFEKRLKKKDSDKPNVFMDVIQGQLVQNDARRKAFQLEALQCKEVKHLLKEYSFEFDKLLQGSGTMTRYFYVHGM